VKTAGLVLALAFGIFGFGVAFGFWSIGYCGSLTPDVARPGTVRHDLCRGTSGDLMSGLVFCSWIVAAVAPLLGMRWALRRGETWPLVATTAVGAVPIVVILVVAEVLPYG
jgi:hypothetical protein